MRGGQDGPQKGCRAVRGVDGAAGSRMVGVCHRLWRNDLRSLLGDAFPERYGELHLFPVALYR